LRAINAQNLATRKDIRSLRDTRNFLYSTVLSSSGKGADTKAFSPLLAESYYFLYFFEVTMLPRQNQQKNRQNQKKNAGNRQQ
jgi:hypothetical protein